MRPRERARLTDGNANSIGAEKKFATAKPKPWESQPYNYEVPTNDGSSLRCDPRRDYVEQNHGPHLDDSTPFNDDGDHGYSSSVFRVTPLLDASASSASEQGTLAGCFGRPKTKDSYRKPGENIEQTMAKLEYDRRLKERERTIQEADEATNTNTRMERIRPH
jgi:hypothetical protein